MTHKHATSLGLVVACGMFASAAPSALAADDSSNGATSAETGKSKSQVEAVIVTAQRHTQNLQKVPVSDSAFSALQLRNRQVVTTQDVLAYVPNVVALSGSGYTQANYYFRGIGESDGFQTFDAPVATYVDDVVLGRLGGANSELLDLDRVEVLRGPQGTVFGRNTTGGAVLLYSHKPDDAYHARAETAYGTNNRSDSRFMFNTPVAPKLDLRLSAFAFHQDGFQKDVNTGQGNYGGQLNWGVRGALRYRPNEDIDWNVAFDYSHEDGQQYNVGTVPTNPSVWTQPQGILGGSYQTVTTSLNDCTKGGSALDWARNNCSGNITTNMGLSSNFKWNVAQDTEIEFITGVRRDTQDYSLDVGFDTPYSIVKDFIIPTDSTFEQLSQEVKVSGKLLNNFITYVGGIYFLREWDQTRFSSILRTGTALQATPADRTPLDDEFVRNGTTSEAAYLQTDMHITPDLTLTTGLRYTHDRKEVEVNERSLANGAPIYDTSDIAGEPVIGTYRFTPKVALTYQITPTFMVYGSYIDGFKSGGWNGRASTASAFTSFGDEKAQSWELGWRSELFDRRLRLNGTFFWVNYADLQLQSSYLASNGEVTSIFANAGNSQVRGVELESTAVITDALSVNASLGLQEAKFTELAPGAVIAGLTENSRVPFSPPATFTLGLTYNTDDLDWAHGRFTFTGNYQWIPSYNTGAQSISGDSSTQDVLNASLTYHPVAAKWSVGLECTNCLFRYYVPIQAGDYEYISQPGYAGMRLRYER